MPSSTPPGKMHLPYLALMAQRAGKSVKDVEFVINKKDPAWHYLAPFPIKVGLNPMRGQS